MTNVQYNGMKKYIESKDRLRKNQNLIDMGQGQSNNKSYEKIRNEAETISYNKRHLVK